MAKDKTPDVGEWIMNEQGTALLIVSTEHPAEHDPHTGTVAVDQVQPFLDAGYHLVGENEPIPVQQHEVDALSTVRVLKDDEDPLEVGARRKLILGAAAKVLVEDESDLVVVTKVPHPAQVLEMRTDATRPGVELPKSGDYLLERP